MEILAVALYFGLATNITKPEVYLRWESYKKYLENYTFINDKNIDSLFVWKQVLLYAIALDVNDNVVEALNEYAIQNNIIPMNYNFDIQLMFSSYGDNFGYFNSSSGGGFSSGGFSGGSSSGGGGGFSGGAVLLIAGTVMAGATFLASRVCKMANVFGDAMEQKSTVRLRSMNDFSTAYNPIRDNYFDGDQEIYNKYKTEVNAIDKFSKEAVNALALVNSLSGVTSMIRSFEKQIVPTAKAAFKINTKATFKSQLRASKNVVVDMAKKQYQSGMFVDDGIYLLDKVIIPKAKDLVNDAYEEALQDFGAEHDINALMSKEEIYRRQGYTVEQIAQKVALDESQAELTKAIGSVPSISRDIKKINKYHQGNIRARDLVTRSYDYASKRFNEVKTFLNGKIEGGSMNIIKNYGKYVMG